MVLSIKIQWLNYGAPLLGSPQSQYYVTLNRKIRACGRSELYCLKEIIYICSLSHTCQMQLHNEIQVGLYRHHKLGSSYT